MRRLGPPFTGQVRADAFVIDVGLLGHERARRRVLERWEAGSTLRAIDGDRWLFVPARPAEVRCELAPGLPLMAHGGGLSLAGSEQPAADGHVRMLEHGRWTERVVTDLPPVDVGAWIDVGPLSIHHLRPYEDAAPTPAPVDPLTAAPPLDLRGLSGIGRRSGHVDELARELASGGSQRGRGSPRGRPATPRWRGLSARVLMRSPVAPVIGRRHARYLRSLTEAFSRQQFDDALREAISLAEGGGFTSLRLPSRRKIIDRPTSQLDRGGGSIPWGPNVYQHLRELYRKAADDLERTGRLGEAAFVLADLMNNVAEAVALLERNGQLELAADLADGRQLEPDLVVRLQWRAGRRQRALDVARARAAFPAAIHRLTEVDPAAARELRVAWVRGLSGSGDHVGAVEAAWPDPELRPSVIGDIEAGMALGGTTSAHLLAYLLAYSSNEHSRRAAVALLRTHDEQLISAREHFLTALTNLPSSDGSVDRELATTALRLMVDRSVTIGWDSDTQRRALKAFRSRADPLVRADLPSVVSHRPAAKASEDRMATEGPAEPGQLRIFDAVPLPGAVLVALGNFGARLLTLDGRVRAQWDVVTHRLTVADYGGVVLLAAQLGDGIWDMHSLHLLSRQVRPWITLRAQHVEHSFDGNLLTVVGVDGSIDFLDVHARTQRALWNELRPVGQAIDLARSERHLSALVHVRAEPPAVTSRLEQWQWELPQMGLRVRAAVPFAPDADSVMTATGHLVRLEMAEECMAVLTVMERGMLKFSEQVRLEGTPYLLSSGPAHGVADVAPTLTRLQVAAKTPGPRTISVHMPAGSEPSMRLHHEVLTVWDDSGRMLLIDVPRRRLIARLRTRL